MARLARQSFCKINLILNVLGKRPDGFHELETVMHPVALSDTLTVESLPTPGIELTCSNPHLPTDAGNLVYRAANAYLQASGRSEGVRIHLEKRIPLAAGLGGGSGNAATTLLALNELWGQRLSPSELNGLAANLGSDVPFFLQPFPALATGRGEHVVPLPSLSKLEQLFVLLIHPGFGVSTPWAYQALAEFPSRVHGERGLAERFVEQLENSDLASALTLLYNALEAPVLRKYPILQLYQEFLRAHGALATLMSGSGSTTFALVTSRSSGESLREAFLRHFGESCWLAVVPLSGPSSSKRAA